MICSEFLYHCCTLHTLTQEDIIFCWDQACNDAFTTLKNHLMDFPALAYPSSEQNATEFVLQTDASAIALGAVLEQQHHTSPYLLSYGRHLPSHHLQDQLLYPTHFQSKLSELHDFVHANLTQAASSQKTFYDHHTSVPSFNIEDPVWLAVPTMGKLDPRWEGEWVVNTVKSPRTKVVHTLRLQYH